MKPLRYHPKVQQDLDNAAGYYRDISVRLEEGFWSEISAALAIIQKHPERCHFDSSGLRRYNLERFPYHILFVEKPDRIRVQVIRHNARRPAFGTRRDKG